MSKLSSLPYQIVDAFTSEPLRGNPAAVVLLAGDDPRANDQHWLIKIAQEFNLSETAYIQRLSTEFEDVPSYRLRWFTPTVEFPLCGHATLASAYVLLNGVHADKASVAFQTMSGTLNARRLGSQIELNLPADVTVLEVDTLEASDLEKVAEILSEMGLEKEKHWLKLAKGRLAWIVELATDVPLPILDLDVKAFKCLQGYVVFTQVAPPHAEEDIWSRVLDPVEDVQEDPVTGSAHCMLAPYWLGDREANKRLTKSRTVEANVLQAKQVSKRGGHLEVEWSREDARILLRGNAVAVMKGELSA